MISRLYARTLEAVEGPYRDQLIMAGQALEAAIPLYVPPTPQPRPFHAPRPEVLEAVAKERETLTQEREARKAAEHEKRQAAVSALEAARALARLKARQEIQNARWDATIGLSTIERRAFENLPKVARAPQFTVNVLRKWLGKRDKLDGTRPVEFSARYSSAYGVVGGGHGCPSAFRAATEALQWFATTPEERTAIREAPSVKTLCDLLAPFNWEVLFHGNMNGIHTYIVRKIVE